MGVTVHFFAFDPAAYPELPTIRGLLAAGDLDRELCVQPQARGRLVEVESHLGGNKRWYDNLIGDDAWQHARGWLPEERRAALDAYLSHLFYGLREREGERCGCGLQRLRVAESEHVYPPELLRHLVEGEEGFWGCEEELDAAFAPKVIRDHWRKGEYFFSADGLEHLRSTWAALLSQAHRAGSGWALLQWVWF